MSSTPHPPPEVGSSPSKSNEWYTPPWCVYAVNEVLGDIDLDPASCPRANAIIGAAHYYTQSENGLAQPWFGRVFLNPPYGKNEHGMSYLSAFVKRAVREYKAARVSAAILLIPVNTGTSWFDDVVWDYYVCFARKRVRFWTTSPTSTNVAAFPSLFVYLGPDPPSFVRVFSRFGRTGRLETGLEAPPARLLAPELWPLTVNQ